MSAPAYLVPDYVAAFQALMPRGRAWPRDPDTAQTATLTGLAKSYETSNAAANALQVQAFPASAVAMLSEWESALGLPGIYGVTPGSTTGRQQAVVAALTDTGGQSKPYLIALAASLGFVITITDFVPWTVAMAVNLPIRGDTWAHIWQVNASASYAISYSPSVDIVQATLNYGAPLLETVLARFKPAHTIVITQYT